MAGNRKLTIEIAGDAKSAGKAFSQISNDASGFGTKVDGASKKAGETFTKFGVGALAVAGAIGVGLFKTGEAASNLGESVNAVNVTFGKSAAGILKLGEDAATAVGLSNTAFNGLAVQFSAFAEAIAGKGGDVVSVMDDMTTRAADFASVMNIEVADAAMLFQSGLAGETEPLRKYGLDLSAAAVKAYALANGIGAASGELTESEKVTARYGLLMESTAKTQGDFANTSDSAANAMRIAKAEMENASASIGASFAPAMAAAAGGIAAVVGGFADLNEASGGWVGKGAGILAVGVGVAGMFSLVVGQATKMKDRFDDARSAMSHLSGMMTNAEGGLTRLGKAAKSVAVALGLAAVAFAAYTYQQKHDAEQAAAYAKALDEITRATDEQAATIVERLIIAWKRFEDMSPAEIVAKLARENLAAATSTRDLAVSSDEFAATLEAQGVTVAMLTKAIDDETTAQVRSQAATEKTTAAIDDQTAAVDEVTTSTTNSTNSATGYSYALYDVAEAEKRATDDADALTAHLGFLQGQWDALTGDINADKAWLDLQTGFNNLKTSAEEAFTAAAKGTEDAEAKGLTYLGNIDDQKLAVITYGQNILGLPQERVTELLAMIDQGRFDDVERKLAILARARAIEILFETKTRSGSIGPLQYAAGGTPSGGSPGGFTWVGEKGPELLKLPRGAEVFSNSASRAMTGGATVVVNVYGSVTSDRDLTRAIFDGIVDGQKRGELPPGII